jgi:hypothetical protein
MSTTFFCLLSFFCCTVYANEDLYKLKVHPFFGIFGPNAEFEIALNDANAVAPAFYIVQMGSDENTSVTYDIGLNWYYYFRSVFESGFFLSPFVHYAYTTGEGNSWNEEMTLTGATLGYQIMWANKIVTSLEAGGAALVTFRRASLPDLEPVPIPVVSFTLGIAF